MTPIPDPPPSLERRVWGGLLAVAGAVAGLAALVYLIGAGTLWLALRSSGYSADVGIEHQPRSQMIGLGLRGLAVVAVLTLGSMVIALGISRIRRVAEKAERVRFRYAAVLGLALLLGALFASWRLLALAIVASTLVFALAFWFRFPCYARRWHWLLLLIPAVVAALAWLYGGPVYVTGAQVTPADALPIDGVRLAKKEEDEGKSWCVRSRVRTQSSYTKLYGQEFWIAEANPCALTPSKTLRQAADHLTEVCPVPYFGESGSFVYVGEIGDVWEPAPGSCEWRRAGPIVELTRSSVHLRFVARQVYLNRSRGKPARAGWDALSSWFQKLKEPDAPSG